MRRLTYVDKSVLIDDRAAVALLAFAAALVRAGEADTVTVNALTTAGHPTEISFVLGTGIGLASESVASSYTEPDNDDTLPDIEMRTERLTSAPDAVEPLHSSDLTDLDFDTY
jgi:hypothetical protein